MIEAGAALVIAAVLSGCLTPLVRRFAVTFGFLDRPDGRLKNHPAPVAYLGGVAIYISFVLALVCTAQLQSLPGIVLAGTIVTIVGLVDDVRGLAPWPKLSGQIIAVLAMLYATGATDFAMPFWLAAGLCFLWLLAVTNAFNLIDIMDGLAPGVGLVAALILAGVALTHGAAVVGIALAALAGSLLGFLPYNLTPASIFMGDAGSLFIGLMLGALAMQQGAATRTPAGVLAPVIILGLPLADMAFVMSVRSSRGVSIMHGSPDHLALLLKKRGLTTRQTVGVSYLTAAAFGALGFSTLLVGAVTAMAIVGTLLLILCVALPRIGGQDRMPT